jgi:F-type H+-transporting ATPase subunit delta
MFAKVVADRYARAALQSCPDLETIERLDDEFELMQRTWQQSAETREFLMNPKIPPAIKITIIRDALSDKISTYMLNLLSLLIEKHRQNILPDIAERYTELTDQVRGVEQAEIIVAYPIPTDLQKRLLDAVQRFSTRDVEIAMRIDPSIYGGVKIKLGDRVIDGSLRWRFEALRRAMLAARLPRMASEEGGAG